MQIATRQASLYHVESGRPVVMILREGKTPGGREVRTVIKHLTRRIRRHFPKTRITWRGDSHYGRPEAIAWCEDNAAGFIFGLAGNIALDRLCQEAADDLCVRRAEACAQTMRAFASFPYQAKSWDKPRKVVARMEATVQGLDIRYVVTSLPGRAQDLYEAVYCERGQAENLIKLHKAQLASDRTSCHSPVANQVRLGAVHRRLLADADAARRHSPGGPARKGRVHHHPRKAHQNRRPRYRAHGPHPRPSADGLSRAGLVRLHRRTVVAGRAMSAGAPCPSERFRRKLSTRRSQGWKIRSASTLARKADCARPGRNRWRLMHGWG